MKEYPEYSRVWDIAERVIIGLIAVAMGVVLWFTVYFAQIILAG